MRQCSQCDCKRLVYVSAKCSDLCWVQWWDGKEQSGYVPSVLGIGNDEDYVDFNVCINCGQLQNYKAKANEKYKEKDKSCTSLKDIYYPKV